MTLRRTFLVLWVSCAAACTQIPTAPPDGSGIDSGGTRPDGAACSCGQCGDDGCGRFCGSCTVGTCVNRVCVCTPQCAPGTECGDDGCGGTCGTCSTGEWCSGGRCVCDPTCSPTRVCGPDGCGGSCGTCPGGQTCTDGVCGCTPTCGSAECGDNGCGGVCGTCASNETCSGGTCVCVPNCAGRNCGPDGCGNPCGMCGLGSTCNASGVCTCTVPITCYQDRDGDGYPTSITMPGCAGSCPSGYIPRRADGRTDCNDNLERVSPAGTYSDRGYCPGEIDCDIAPPPCLGIACGDPYFDMNCSGTEERQWTTVGGGCSYVLGMGCRFSGSPGWQASVPDCGVLGWWRDGTCGAGPTCTPNATTRVQACR